MNEAFLEPAGATAEVLEIGYPRNDVLQSDEAPAIRDRVRKVLGIADGQRVVMYAPTFRDYMSADDMAAERIDFFDVDRAARDIGPGYTFLVRGHAFNARAGGKHEGGANILDVTGHPDINDLILASDCAVLDYSSLALRLRARRQADDLPGARPARSTTRSAAGSSPTPPPHPART